MNMIDSSITSKLKEIVGEKHASDDPLELYCYSHDMVSRTLSWISEDFDFHPDLVVKPLNEDQVKKIIDLANNEHLKIITLF